MQGLGAAQQKRSDVDAEGAPRVDLIDGLRYRPARPVAHDDGSLTEIARAGWEILDEPIVQVHMTTTLPGRIRVWGLHRRTADRLFVVSGLVRIVCYDGRETSPTCGCINQFIVSERNPALLLIPPSIYHGWKNIGTTECIVVNMPTRAYNYPQPDSLDLPWDCAAASDIIPYRW